MIVILWQCKSMLRQIFWACNGVLTKQLALRLYIASGTSHYTMGNDWDLDISGRLVDSQLGGEHCRIQSSRPGEQESCTLIEIVCCIQSITVIAQFNIALKASGQA